MRMTVECFYWLAMVYNANKPSDRRNWNYAVDLYKSMHESMHNFDKMMVKKFIGGATDGELQSLSAYFSEKICGNYLPQELHTLYAMRAAFEAHSWLIDLY